MTRERVFDIWKGRGHPWTKWVKPCVFDAVPAVTDSAAEELPPYRAESPPWASIDTQWLRDDAAVIVDLPGEESLLLGLALGERGLRQVLVINGCSAEGEVVDMRPVIDMVRVGARFPRAFPSAASMRPAFVLDSRRDGGGREPAPGAFDNRWTLFEDDLPDARALAAHGVAEVVVVHRGPLIDDLAGALRGYARRGLRLRGRDLDGDGREIEIPLPSALLVPGLFDRIRQRFSLRRRWDGSFGRRVPVPPDPRHG
jgi:hypothetical protein